MGGGVRGSSPVGKGGPELRRPDFAKNDTRLGIDAVFLCD